MNFRLKMVAWSVLSIVLIVGVLFGAAHWHLDGELRKEGRDLSHVSNPDWTIHGSYTDAEVQDILGPALKPFYDGKPELTRDEGIRSTALAGMTLMLAAKGMGYDSCPMVGFDFDAVAKLINLPANHALSFMIAVGKETQGAWPRGERLPDSTVVIEDKF